jgi:hypothetical protein
MKDSNKFPLYLYGPCDEVNIVPVVGDTIAIMIYSTRVSFKIVTDVITDEYGYITIWVAGDKQYRLSECFIIRYEEIN